uniref:Uncharacterized protein n=1 Tax=Lepeophtheirus salmonis TaxID=72036 RepID=A0A0K2TA10_LEPSM
MMLSPISNDMDSCFIALQ